MDTLLAENMKGRCHSTTEFRIPLSSEALEILQQACLLFCNDFLFSATGRGSFHVGASFI